MKGCLTRKYLVSLKELDHHKRGLYGLVLTHSIITHSQMLTRLKVLEVHVKSKDVRLEMHL